MSKNFKKAIQTTMSARQERAMEEEIRRQCIESNKKYEKMWDISVLNALNKTLHIGYKRAKSVYIEMLKQRNLMERCFMDADGAEKFICESNFDIDFDTFYEECKKEAGVEE